MGTLSLYCNVPVCSFRPRWSREYQDTYPIPPPSTVYGMLLSLVGVPWQEKQEHAGVRLALALCSRPEQAKVYRKLRRVPQSDRSANPLTARRPEYQDILLGLRFWIWLRDEAARHPLVPKIEQALGPERAKVRRVGGLSLGESSHLVDSLAIRDPEGQGRYLRCDPQGTLSLPIWVHHPRNGKGKTRMGRFSLDEPTSLVEPPQDNNHWIGIAPP